MSDPRPLTPPEVRELMSTNVGSSAEWDREGRYARFEDVRAIVDAMIGNATLRATLERYAELAEAHGE